MPVTQKKRLKKLTIAQKKRLQEHSKHHSVPHMRAMRWDMMMGMSFDDAHKLAMKKHGK